MRNRFIRDAANRVQAQPSPLSLFKFAARAALVAGALLCFLASGQTSTRARLIVQAVDESKLVHLSGNTRPEAVAANDRGRVDDSLQLDHLLLQLKRSPEQESAVQKFLDDLQDPHSPNYHQWLT